MSDWKNYRFGALFSIPLRNGLTKPSYVRGAGTRMVNMREIFGYDKIDDDVEMEFVPVSEKERSSLLQYDDLLFARQSLVESGAGKISIFKGKEDAVFESHLIRCRVDTTKANPDFVYYLFRSPVGRGTISGIVSQTAAAGIRGSDLEDLVFTFPPLPEQRAIAGVLSSLDDKIDLLHRQNKTLEGIASALWRKMFIEDADPNWEKGTLGDIADNIRVNVCVAELNNYEHYVGLEHIEKKHFALYDWGNTSELESNKSCFSNRDILFGKLRAYFHKVCFAPVDGVCSTDILVIRPKTPEFHTLCLLWFFSEDVVNYSDASSGGTRMPRTNWDTLASYEILIPTGESVAEFNHHVLPMIDRIEHNIFSIRTLSRLRDTLLPKLMSGEVKVKL